MVLVIQQDCIGLPSCRRSHIFTTALLRFYQPLSNLKTSANGSVHWIGREPDIRLVVITFLDKVPTGSEETKTVLYC
ncbi:hypothetical protein H634G_11359 [Metarhizium anisopliae BRIP 53293]|uniref:Uncharacterized protein n=1 Tax=Metarhizium anisopliae BRIP 53293 TaxID=1291518 RepID=A0A0D9NHD2_METAN|nr:hypothetical protein H634G_11359 [Metarhizium anisopliae BRIP 53293]